jgi:hypothetical protein
MRVKVKKLRNIDKINDPGKCAVINEKQYFCGRLTKPRIS